MSEKKLKRLAKTLDVSLTDIQMANGTQHFSPGQWIFIPTRKGLAGKFKSKSGPDYPANLSHLSLLWPVPASKRISSYFKTSNRPNHLGIDIPAKKGTHVLAAADGLVFYSGRGLKGYGNLIILKHDHNIFTVYAHAKKNFVKKGQRVHRGQVISKVGTTGRSTGPHLHFEVRIKNRPIDPMPFMRGAQKVARMR